MKIIFRSSMLLFIWWLLFSLPAKSEPPAEADFEFLKISIENATMVEDEARLAGSIVGVAASTVIDEGFWYLVCKAPSTISKLVKSYQLINGQEQAAAIETDFCLNFALLVTSTEIQLSGHSYDFPLDSVWKGYIFWASAGISAYVFLANGPELSLVAILAPLSAEAFSRTLNSGILTFALRKKEIIDINDSLYRVGEYLTFSVITGVLAGVVVGEVLFHKTKLAKVKTGLISVASAVITGAAAGGISIKTIEFSEQEEKMTHMVRAIAIVPSLSGVIMLIGAGAECLSNNGRHIRYAAIPVPLVLLGPISKVLAVMVGVFISYPLPEGLVIDLPITLAGSLIGAGSTVAIYTLANKQPVLAILTSIGVTGIYSLVNSFSAYFISGTPLEQSYLEIPKNLIRKFYEPLIYLSTLLD